MELVIEGDADTGVERPITIMVETDEEAREDIAVARPAALTLIARPAGPNLTKKGRRTQGSSPETTLSHPSPGQGPQQKKGAGCWLRATAHP